MVQKRKDGRRGDNPLAAIYVECTSLSRTHVVRTHKARPFRAHTSCGIRPPVRCHPSRPGSEASPFSQRRRRAARGEDTHSPLPSGATNPPHSIDPACRDTQRQHNCQRLTERAQRGQGCAIFFPLLLLSCFFCSPAPRHTCTSHTTESRPPPRKVRIQLRWTAQAPQAATPGQPPEGESGLNRFATGSAVREIIGRLICQIEAASRQTTAAAGCRGCDQKATSCPLQGSVLGAGAALPPLFASHGAGRRRQRGRCCPSLASATECVAGAQSAR